MSAPSSPTRRSLIRLSAVRTPEPSAAGARRDPGGQPPDATGTLRELAQAALEVRRHEAHGDDQDDPDRAQSSRQDGQGERSLTGEQAPAQAETADHQRPEVHRVLDDVAGDHPARDHSRVHPGAPQRPHGQGHPAGAGGRQQPDRGDPGQRDLQAGPPVDAIVPAPEHGSEQERVAAQRHQLQQHRDRQEHRVAVLELSPCPLEAGQLRDEEVQADERDEREDRPQDDLPAADRTGRLGARADVVGDPRCVRRLLWSLRHQT